MKLTEYQHLLVTATTGKEITHFLALITLIRNIPISVKERVEND